MFLPVQVGSGVTPSLPAWGFYLYSYTPGFLPAQVSSDVSSLRAVVSSLPGEVDVKGFYLFPVRVGVEGFTSLGVVSSLPGQVSSGVPHLESSLSRGCASHSAALKV